MAEKTHQGYFLIADISGYTRYLSESELEHAQQTLTALLELLVDLTRPPLVISRLAGDAVISYALRERFFQGQTLVEKIENTYVAFRKAIERLVLNTNCPCRACANIGNLDLKFFVHFGRFGLQHIGDHDELVGSDVNLIHRLLKNSIVERTGISAYALYTEAAANQLALGELTAAMTAHREHYDHLGDVQMWVQDMHPVWESKRDELTVTLPADQIIARNEVAINLPAEQVWDYLIRPEFRNLIIHADRMETSNRQNGRLGPGSVYQCYHGDKMVPQTILEWQPFERMLTKEVPPIAPTASALVEYRLEPTDEGTRLIRSVGKMAGPLHWRAIMRLLTPLFNRVMQQGVDSFARQIEDDYRAHRGGPDSAVEPTSEQIQEAAAASLGRTDEEPDAD
ncbi:MAG: DUF2652 domain-containing protein [Candidatus Promineifilaceae bacterium]|nr:DUF2652 domain-containing protein [Candidatus Promineifilaceae bacterium]